MAARRTTLDTDLNREWLEGERKMRQQKGEMRQQKEGDEREGHIHAVVTPSFDKRAKVRS